MEDLSPRARRLLAEVDFLACEDTRETRSLLARLGISRQLGAYHDHNEREAAPGLIKLLREGRSVALVSDSGTPLVDDPGWHLLQAAIQAGIHVVSVPGPSAALVAVVASGLPVGGFRFVGFLPRKEGPRRARLAELRADKGTLVLHEAPHRLRELLTDALEVLGERPAVLAFNLTKPTERFERGPLSELLAGLPEEVRGEITIVIGGAPEDEEEAWRKFESAMAQLEGVEVPVRALADFAAELGGLPRTEVYRRILARRRVL